MWFEDLMGFKEGSPEQVRDTITVEGEYLVSKANGRRVRCGRLSIPSLRELRELAKERVSSSPDTTVDEVVGDVLALHRDPRNAGALFQAASQFNLLEMAAPSVTPERGVGIYELDRTQGPACAVACGGGTIVRNYFAPLGGHLGQTAERQIDCLKVLGEALGQPGLWEMSNGYALANSEGLRRIGDTLAALSEPERDTLRALLEVGVQHEVEVLGSGHAVTQVYCSALPVAYGRPPGELWEPFARLVLEATYEATLLVARLEGIEEVFLTCVGGGVFGNESAWISDAIVRALRLVPGLEVHLVSYGRSNPETRRLVERYSEARLARSRP